MPSDTSRAAASPRRYHHGNLREALIEEGMALTRVGGAAALSVRDVARRIGVSPNAAYRHFADRDDLLSAVVVQIQRHIAEDMRRIAPAPGEIDDPATAAIAGLRAVGVGYIEFALAEPGWFDVAFDPQWLSAQRLAEQQPAPLASLLTALDTLVETGVLTLRQRPGLEWTCWSAVHGFALLALHGPLRQLPRDDLAREAHRMVETVIAGVVRAADATAHNRPASKSRQ